MAPEGMLGIDCQKLGILQCYLLKASYSSSLLCRHPLLWEKRVPGEDEEEGYKVGLGLKDIIKKYGFGWLPNHMFNWEANMFAAGIGDQFPFPVRRLEKRYQRRKGERATMMDILQEMDQAIGRIKILGEKEGDEAKRLLLLRWLGTRIMRQYHQDVWEALYKSPFEFKGKESELERQEQQERDDEIDSEDEEPRPRKRAWITKKMPK